ncbi:MAG TPA: NAD(P)-binding domain-containing protein, partial [Solirubrobacteraceae bacterium]|nr:NAD(P)-binding domain-containing protein [Solirubrobacteraceae bacterium]
MSGTIAVIGAGASGLATARQLQLAGLPFEVLEQTGDIGGNWRLAADNEHAGVFASTHANTSRQIMAFSEHDMPDGLPTYPHHSQLLAYLRSYAGRFGLVEHVRTGHPVQAATPVDGGRGGWDVIVGGGAPVRYRALCVASGHHWAARVPALAGEFGGTSLHAKAYRTRSGFAGKRVLLVGLGASGADIAVDLSHVARSVDVSVRRGYHIVPKIVMGRPLDHFAFERKKSLLPPGVRRKLTDKLLGTLIGDPTPFGFPRPTHGLRDVSPTISQELLGRIAQGSVVIRPDVDVLEGDRVRFADGTGDRYDVLIYATGYDIACPFLPPDVLPTGTPFAMYRHVVHPVAENLFFIGFVQPLGGFWPVSEAQAQWVAAMLRGTVPRPGAEWMRAAIDAAWSAFRAEGRGSHDTFIQVEQDLYLLDLWREMVPAGTRRRARQRLRDRLALAEHPLCLAQLADDLLGSVPASLHALESSLPMIVGEKYSHKH